MRTDGGWLTDIPGVVAVGDVARHDCGGRVVRHEHWTAAAEQPAVAAATLLTGRHTAHRDGRGYFWSDRYGVRIRFAGGILGCDEVRVIEGSVEDRGGLASCHRDGRTTGVLAMNMAREFDRALGTIAASTEEDDQCRRCTSAAPGATRSPAVDTTSSTPSTGP